MCQKKRNIGVPFRRCVPSGRFAGPTEKPFRGFFEIDEVSFVSSWVFFDAMVASLHEQASYRVFQRACEMVGAST